MGPAPSLNQQRIAVDLLWALQCWLRSHPGPCEAFAAPFDVLLPAGADQADGEVDTVVQPDIVVVCDPAKLSARFCRGAPDFAVEILSPCTGHRDQVQKLDPYARHGVREHWIVEPASRSVRTCRLAEGAPRRFDPPGPAVETGRVESAALAGFGIDLQELFARVA